MEVLVFFLKKKKRKEKKLKSFTTPEGFGPNKNRPLLQFYAEWSVKRISALRPKVHIYRFQRRIGEK